MNNRLNELLGFVRSQVNRIEVLRDRIGRHEIARARNVMRDARHLQLG